MAITKLERITQVPDGSLRRIALMYPNMIECYECDTVPDIITAAQEYPLELMLIAQTNKGVIEKHFLVGIAVPSKKDKFKAPLFYFVHIPSDRFREIEALVKEHKRNKSVLYGPNGKRLSN